MTQQPHCRAYTLRKPELKETHVAQCSLQQLLLLLLLSCFSRVQLCDPIDGSPPGSSIPGILKARTLEWVAISFSNAWQWKVKVKSLSRVWPLATPWTAAYQAPLSMGFSRHQYWSGVPLPSIVALFTIARTWKQPRCPLADEWIRKLWYIYTMEYYSPTKRNAFESVLMRWMKLESII